MSDQNLPVKWEEELAKHAKAVAKLETPKLAKISLQAGVMQYQGIAVPGNRMECIILAFAFERRYDTKQYDPGNITPPDCFSLSLDDSDETAPWPTVLVPQNDKCLTCEMNKWTPNPRRPGKNHKPCKERRRLVVIPNTKQISAAEMAMITVPVTSLKFWGQYVNGISAAYNRPPWAMVSEISVLPDPKTQFQVKFAAVEPIPEEYLGQIYARVPLAQNAAMQPWDVIPMDQKPQEAPKQSTKY